jgi:hypothetical protein
MVTQSHPWVEPSSIGHRPAETPWGRNLPQNVRGYPIDVFSPLVEAAEADVHPFREGTKGAQVAHFAVIRFVMERDDLPGPELWLMIERSCDQVFYIKYYLRN